MVYNNILGKGLLKTFQLWHIYICIADLDNCLILAHSPGDVMIALHDGPDAPCSQGSDAVYVKLSQSAIHIIKCDGSVLASKSVSNINGSETSLWACLSVRRWLVGRFYCFSVGMSVITSCPSLFPKRAEIFTSMLSRNFKVGTKRHFKITMSIPSPMTPSFPPQSTCFYCR